MCEKTYSKIRFANFGSAREVGQKYCIQPRDGPWRPAVCERVQANVAAYNKPLPKLLPRGFFGRLS